MGWYNPEFTRRAIITIPNSTGALADVDIDIPRSWDQFWDVIDSSGNELRVVDADSQTLLSYSVDDGSGGAFNKASQLGRIRIDGWNPPGAGTYAIWLYWRSTSVLGSGAVSTTISGSIPGYIELSRPHDLVYQYKLQATSAGRPRDILVKTSGETREVWIEVTHALAPSRGGLNESRTYEEVTYATTQVLTTAGSDTPAMYSDTKLRFVYDERQGRTYVKLYITGGTDGTEYTIAPLIRTTRPGESGEVHQTLQPRIGLAVRDVLLPSI